jgi:hypothetical protein
MRSNRRRNWFIKRIALGLAIAAFAAPVAQAKVDEGPAVQSNGFQAFVTDFPSYSIVNASDYGMPRAMPSDYALANRDQLVRADVPGDTVSNIGEPQVVRADVPGDTVSDIGELQVASRFGQPNATTGDELASWNVDWQDAGIGAGLALALLLGGGAALASRHVGRAQTA